jgi:hypothetical protein
VVEDQADFFDPPPDRFGDDDLLKKGLKVGKTFALATTAIDLTVGDTQSGEQLASSPANIAGRQVQRLVGRRRNGVINALPGLERGFFIHTNDPNSRFQQVKGLLIQVQDRFGPFQKEWISDVLPQMIPPRLQSLRFQPAPDRAGRNLTDEAQSDQGYGQLGTTPTAQRHRPFLRQATSQNRRFRPHLRGKKAGAVRSGLLLSNYDFDTTASATCALVLLSSLLQPPRAYHSTQDGQHRLELSWPVVLQPPGFCGRLPHPLRIGVVFHLSRFDSFFFGQPLRFSLIALSFKDTSS